MKLLSIFMKCYRCIVPLLLFIFIYPDIQAQHSLVLDTINVSQIKSLEKINDFTLWFTDPTHSIKQQDLPGLLFRNKIPDHLAIAVPASLVQQTVYVRFIVRNTSDTTINFYFLPGFYYTNIILYRVNPYTHVAVQIPEYDKEVLGFKKIVLHAKETSDLIAKLDFVKTTINNLSPLLVQEFYLPSLKAELQTGGKDKNTITFIFTGILLAMILYSIAVFVLNRNIEFLYYAGFALTMGILFFLKSYLYKTPSAFNYFFESYLDFVIQSIGTFIYLSFLREFINARRKFYFLHTMFSIEQVLIVISICIFSYLHFFTNYFMLQNRVENNSKYVWILSTVIFVIYAIKSKNKLLNYLAIGHSFLLIAGVISLYLIISATRFEKSLPPILNDSLFYYEAGLTIELVFFLVALAFKNKNDIVERTKDRERLKLLNERQEFEKQLAVISAKQEERNRISADMHDELGSGVTAIRLMSEVVKSKMKENTLPEIYRISNAANELINKMNTIIWTMKSEHDSVQSLISYIRTYALEFFENTAIECYVNIPPSFPNLEISGEKRRNIFLSVKESLNNILKHSKASRVIISFIIEEKLTIVIKDNGIGIELDKLRQFGNGLKNIKKRIEGIEGTYRIENKEGTKTTLELNL